MSNKLREFREKRRMTQAKLAELSGVSRTSISYLEQGRQKLRYPTAEKLAAILGCTPDDLIGSDAVQAHFIGQHPTVSLNDVLESIVDDISLRSVSRAGRSIVLSCERDRQLYRLLVGATRLGDSELRTLADRAAVMESDYLARTLGGED